MRGKALALGVIQRRSYFQLLSARRNAVVNPLATEVDGSGPSPLGEFSYDTSAISSIVHARSKNLKSRLDFRYSLYPRNNQAVNESEAGQTGQHGQPGQSCRPDARKTFILIPHPLGTSVQESPERVEKEEDCCARFSKVESRLTQFPLASSLLSPTLLSDSTSSTSSFSSRWALPTPSPSHSHSRLPVAITRPSVSSTWLSGSISLFSMSTSGGASLSPFCANQQHSFSRHGYSSSATNGESLGIDGAAVTGSEVLANEVVTRGSEVAVAASQVWAPVGALQHLMESVHVYTGLPWWLSIALTTVAMRLVLLPVMVYQIKAASRLAIVRPDLERLNESVKHTNYDPAAIERYRKEMKDLLIRNKTSPFAPLMGIFIQAPIFISFYFAIQGMVEHVPSLATGGAFWFVDLTTADPFYVLPVLSSLTILASVELGAAEGMENQPNAKQMKMFMRGMGVVMIPLTISFPKAVFCYWVSTNIFSLVQGIVLKQAGVRAALGIPNVAEALKKADEGRHNQRTAKGPTRLSALPPKRAASSPLLPHRRKQKT